MRVSLFGCSSTLLFSSWLSTMGLAMEAPPVYSLEKAECHTKENLDLGALPAGFSQYQTVKVWNPEIQTESEYTVSNFLHTEHWSKSRFRRSKRTLTPIQSHDHGNLFHVRLKRDPHERFGFNIQTNGKSKENRMMRIRDASSAKERGLFAGDIILATSEDGIRYLDVTGEKARGVALTIYLNSLHTEHMHFIIRRGKEIQKSTEVRHIAELSASFEGAYGIKIRSDDALTPTSHCIFEIVHSKLNIKVGDLIEAINDIPTKDLTHYELSAFFRKTDKPSVILTLLRKSK